jgi:glucose-6-phosphate 1-dehydrogenase
VSISLEPSTIVIFGASGDLTRRKLVPALFNLYLKDRLPAETRIVGFARRPYTNSDFRAQVHEGVEQFSNASFEAEKWDAFASMLSYFQGNLHVPEDLKRLQTYLHELEESPRNWLYYLATSPTLYEAAVANLGAVGMASQTNASRNIVIEKPFGHDLASAQALNHAVHQVFNESQVYRIDHYLAKETVQNILVFRFGNTFFEPIWNRNYIDHVQITVAESVDVEHRAGYYEQAGVLRDMFQNHLMQLLALVSMEPPFSFNADAVRNEKVKALSSIRPMIQEDIETHTLRGQYQGYLDATGVNPDSQIPTFAVLQLYIDNWRWQGVPFYLRSGKALTEKVSEIIIQFKQPPHMMFPMRPEQRLRSNFLALCLQPHEGIHQRFEAKVPDTTAEMESVDMSFHYDEAFGPGAIPEAYERLLLNALEGDATLFTRSDGIEAAWRTIDPILQAWETDAAPPLFTYDPGSWGPAEADDMLALTGRKWRYSCGEL